jgi:hypothetical protein
VVILRPVGLSPLALVYLLASHLGKCSFGEQSRAQAVRRLEDDERRFVFPSSILKTVDQVAAKIKTERQQIMKQRRDLDLKEAALWKQFDKFAT